MKFIITLQARLKNSPEESQKISDGLFTDENIQMFKAAGNTAHFTFLNPIDPTDFLAIDHWEAESAEQVLNFYKNPDFEKVFQSFAKAAPEIKLWNKTSWKSFNVEAKNSKRKTFG